MAYKLNAIFFFDIRNINTEIRVNGQKLETVTSFKHLGSVTTNEGSKPDDTLKDSSDNCSIDKVVTSLE